MNAPALTGSVSTEPRLTNTPIQNVSRKHAAATEQAVQLKLSVVVPVYNESATVEEIVERLLVLKEVTQVILVNDGSDAITTELLNQLSENGRVEVIHHEQNQGKGAALQTGFKACCGDVIAIQDADLEYAPEELPRLMRPITGSEADVVYGSRWRGDNRQAGPLIRRLANRFLTALSNRLTGLSLTDMETGYKVFSAKALKSIHLKEQHFGIEPELTAKIAAGGWRVVELPINYQPRGYNEGKKIGIRDGIRAIWCIWHYRK